MDTKAHTDLATIFQAAIEFTLTGKGEERHGNGVPFESQPIHSVPLHLGACGKGFLLGQAAKKIFESANLPADKAYLELLGAMAYANRAAKLAQDGKW